MKKGLALLLTAMVAISSFTACDFSGLIEKFAGSSEQEEETGLEINAYNGAVVDLTPEEYGPYLALTEESDIAEYLFKQNAGGKTRPVLAAKDMTLSWKRNGMASRYTVRLYDTQDLKSQVFYTTTENSYCAVENLMPGTYYWQVADNLGNASEVDSFVIGDYVRAMNVDKIKNFRDMGGWKTESGKKLRYGMTYRCGALTSDNGSALAELGVATEIDLRADAGYETSVISSKYGIRFLQAGIMQGDYVLKDKSFYSSLTPEQIEEKRHSEAAFKQEYADALYEAFKLYTNENNYPILFHCTSGADRTGTFAFLLGGMLGMELDDLYRDFELTCFAMGGKRWRSNIEQDENGKYYFNDDGYVTVSDNYVAIGLLYKGLMECYSTGDGKLSSAIKNYLKTDVGLTDEDFEAIENIMLA